MTFTLDNFVRSNLAVDAGAADTSLVVALAASPLRDPPDATADAPGILILQDLPAAPTLIEIVTYTGRSIVGTRVTLTGVTRGCEGTTARAWTTGVPTFSGTTAAVLAQFALKAELAAVATSGSYNDLEGRPALGTAAAKNVDDFASAAQGAKADTALQGGSQFATAAQGAKADSAVQPNTSPAFASVAVATGVVQNNLGTWGLVNNSGGKVAGVWFDVAGQISLIGNWSARFDVREDGALINGQQVWHSGNLNPSLYAPLTGSAFIGNVSVPNLAVTASVSIGTVANVFTDFNGTLKITGEMAYRYANSSALVRIPRIFVQSGDPGNTGAAEGDLWLW